jgi:hypothetical protein
MWLVTEFMFNFVEISYGQLQTQCLTDVLIQEEHNLWLWLKNTKHILCALGSTSPVEPKVSGNGRT